MVNDMYMCLITFFSILSFNLTSVGKIIVLHGDSNSKIYKICQKFHLFISSIQAM